MRYLFYFGHPAQYLFARESIKKLIETKQEVIILIKSKDVLEDLILRDGLKYINILPDQRGNRKIDIAFSLIKRNLKIFPYLLKYRPNILIGTDASLAQLGFLFRIHCVTITEDDFSVIKTLAKLTYPFTNTILCPEVCNVGKWSHKKVGYKGYMKLGYLHPDIFTPDVEVLSKYNITGKYVIIRMAKLTAHHDFGIKGMGLPLVEKIISQVVSYGYRVIVSTEDKIDAKLKRYQLDLDPSHMHHLLAFSSLLICDSQSMSLESAILGVPSIRYSDFVGRISVLDELENVYGLTFGICPGKDEQLVSKIAEILGEEVDTTLYKIRQSKMLGEKINVSSFLTWFLINYPSSVGVIKHDLDFQNTFI